MITSKNNPYATTALFLAESFYSNPLINTTIFETGDNIDLNKENIFPLAHIMPGPVNIVENRLESEFTIVVANIRTKSNKPNNKLFGDNLIDNLNTSIAVLTKEITKISLQRNEYDIILVSSTPAQPVIFSSKNLLDGYECTIILSIQNEIDTRG